MTNEIIATDVDTILSYVVLCQILSSVILCAALSYVILYDEEAIYDNHDACRKEK